MKTKIALPRFAEEEFGDRLPDWVDPIWFSNREQALVVAEHVEIGWFDMFDKPATFDALAAAKKLRWANSLIAGLDLLPLDLMRDRGVVYTNGAGINAITIAEFAVMGMLAIAKGYRDIVHAQTQHRWLTKPAGTAELFESKALLLGYGEIGKNIDKILRSFGVDVTIVRRRASSDGSTLGPNDWKHRLGEFDWVVVAVPGTAETERLLSSREFCAMKSTAVIVNVARGSIVDQDALVVALQNRTIGGAFLDVTEPEPLPSDHPLWGLDNAHVTMHLSGRSQTRMVERSVSRFLRNLERYRRGEELQHAVDLSLGY